MLNEKQKLAAETINGPLLIIAGAGTGKTTTLIHRVAHMINSGIEPESILLLTFTNAAAQEMKDRADKMIENKNGNITACTYHSFCAQMLRQYGKAIDVRRDFSILTPSEVNDAISFIKAENEKKYKLRGFPNSAIIAGIFSTAINKNLTIREVLEDEKYEKYQSFEREIIELKHDYTCYKNEKNLLDYDDLLVKFYELMKVEVIRSRIEDSYKYIMVDEYQDTNNLQEKIILAMRKGNRNIAVVGDDYQSIYAFRGSNINNILEFDERFSGCKKTIIDINYRSTQQILNLANAIMSRYANFGYPKNMQSTGLNGNKPILCRTNNQDAEVSFILEEIKRRYEAGIPYKEIAVLERSSTSSFALEAELNARGIPYEKRGGLKFMEHVCVMDMIAYLKCITNPYDTLAWFRILQVHPGIGDTFARNISQDCGINPKFLIENQYTKRAFYSELELLHNKMNSIRHMSFLTQFDELVKFYYDARYRAIETMVTKDEGNRTDAFETLDADMKVLGILRDMLFKYDSALEFLDAITLQATPDHPETSDSDDKLVISTIHSAKGLEWDTVFIMDCVDGVFPGVSPVEFGSPDDMEELRCFYVAVTRAKQKLFLISPEWIVRYGKGFPGTPSHYLQGCENTYTVIKY